MTAFLICGLIAAVYVLGVLVLLFLAHLKDRRERDIVAQCNRELSEWQPPHVPGPSIRRHVPTPYEAKPEKEYRLP